MILYFHQKKQKKKFGQNTQNVTPSVVLLVVRKAAAYNATSTLTIYVFDWNYIKREDLLRQTLEDCKAFPPSTFEWPTLMHNYPEGPFVDHAQTYLTDFPPHIFPAIDRLVDRLTQQTAAFQPLTPHQVHGEGLGANLHECRLYLCAFSHIRQSILSHSLFFFSLSNWPLTWNSLSLSL